MKINEGPEYGFDSDTFFHIEVSWKERRENGLISGVWHIYDNTR